MAVRAKFYVREVSQFVWSAGQRPLVDQKTVKMSVVMGPDGDNAEWAKASPSGNLEITITNPAAFNQFEVGQYVYLTMEPVPFQEPTP